MSRSSVSRSVVEFLWDGRRGKPVTIPEVTTAAFGHSGAKQREWIITHISHIRKFAESRGYGMLISVHEDSHHSSKVTHLILADGKTDPKYTAHELTMRQARAMGFIQSRDRGIKVAVKDKLLPEAQMKKALRVEAKPLFLPAEVQQKLIAETEAHIKEKETPKVGKPVKRLD